MRLSSQGASFTQAGPCRTSSRQPFSVAHKQTGTKPNRTVTPQASSNTNNLPASSSDDSKIALAAKISAARTLARKLADEKQAAAAAAKLSSTRALDPESAAELIRSAEAEVSDMAREAAMADSMARAAKKAESNPELAELQRLKAENAALQELVVQLAANRAEAEKQLMELKENGVPSVAASSGSSSAARLKAAQVRQPSLLYFCSSVSSVNNNRH